MPCFYLASPYRAIIKWWRFVPSWADLLLQFLQRKKTMVKCKYLRGDLPQSLVSSLDLRGREIGRCELRSLKNQDSKAESHGMNIKVDPLAKGWKGRKTHPSLGVCSSQAHATLSNALPLGDNQSTDSKANLLKQHHRNIQKWRFIQSCRPLTQAGWHRTIITPYIGSCWSVHLFWYKLFCEIHILGF